MSGDTPRTAAPGISCRALSFTSSRLSLRTPERSHFGDESASQSFVLGALSVSRRVSPEVAGQPPGAIEYRIYQDPTRVTHELSDGRIRAVTKMLLTL